MTEIQTDISKLDLVETQVFSNVGWMITRTPDIAKSAKLDTPTTLTILKRLERKGYVRHIASENSYAWKRIV